jgi:hypothetical protein
VKQRPNSIAVPDWPLVLCMEYVAPSPPTPLPRFTWARGAFSFQLSNGVRAGKGEMLRNVTCLF